ncbi:MAG: deoxyguanosinetriphosphate triphosphohydrolase [Lachnospiraceae bacterium]|nr:deoxyguanosinetriphosphate triphosphohydrolase [Lachnospiraceae bacterium]
MKWQQLLSQKRRGSLASGRERKDLRTEFEKDYHRIIGSASFRRLQDKTQVFPLDKSDFIRTRLTHSLEVSSIGRSLAENISASIMEKRLDPTFTLETKEAVCEILQCAGLIHDIGNPPFGHFGEEAIREWFVHHLPELMVNGRRAVDLLDEQELADLLHFEGNAQGLRLVSKLHFFNNEHGMDLTYGLLSCMIKYPVSSVEIDDSAADIRFKKMGYFKAEQDLFDTIQTETGTCGARNPLTFILEAADDIAYATADIEDAFKKGFFDIYTFRKEMDERGVPVEIIATLDELYEEALCRKLTNPQEYVLMNSLTIWQNRLLETATDSFITHYKAIMDGTFVSDLLSGSRDGVLLEALKGIAYDYAFTSASIYRTEIAANTILTYLLDHLVPAAVAFNGRTSPGLMEEKFISLVSDNYKATYNHESVGLDENRKLYLKLLLVTDSISGMTDSHARDLFHELTGNKI